MKENLKEECLARSVDLEKSSVASMSRYTEACAKLSIDPDGDVKNQILLGKTFCVMLKKWNFNYRTSWLTNRSCRNREMFKWIK